MTAILHQQSHQGILLSTARCRIITKQMPKTKLSVLFTPSMFKCGYAGDFVIRHNKVYFLKAF